jgi:integrase
MARLYRKRGIWYAWGILAGGERWALSTRTKDKRQAQRAGRDIERDVLRAAGVSARASTSLTAAFEALDKSQRARELAPGSLRSAAQHAGHLVRLLGADRDIATFMPPLGLEVLRGYVAARVAEGTKRSTAAAEISTLKQALRTMAREGRWPGDTRLLVIDELRKAHRPRKTRHTPEQAARMLAKIPPQWREHAETYLQTGVRRMELYTLTASDVDRAGNRVHVRGTKTELADRWIPMTARVRAILTARAKAHPTGPLFNEWTRALPDLAAACVLAKVPKVTVTDLRRTFASSLLSAGVSASVLKEILGHSTTKQIDITYGHASDDAKQAAVDRLPGSRAVADTGTAVRRKRQKRAAAPSKDVQPLKRRSTSGLATDVHWLRAFADFGAPVAER